MSIGKVENAPSVHDFYIKGTYPSDIALKCTLIHNDGFRQDHCAINEVYDVKSDIQKPTHYIIYCSVSLDGFHDPKLGGDHSGYFTKRVLIKYNSDSRTGSVEDIKERCHNPRAEYIGSCCARRP